MSNNEVDNRDEGRDGPDGNGGGDNGISPSQITACTTEPEKVGIKLFE